MHDPSAPESPCGAARSPCSPTRRGQGARARAHRDAALARLRERRVRGPQPRRAATPTRRSTWPAAASPTASRPWWCAAATGWCTSACRRSPAPAYPLGIIPAGTGNDVARYFDLPRKDPVAAADRVIASRTPHHRPGPQRRPLLRHRAGRRLRRDRQRARQRDDLAQGPDALQPRHPGRAAHLPAAPLHPRPRRRDASSSRRCWSRSATARPSAAACGSPRARCSTTACSTW